MDRKKEQEMMQQEVHWKGGLAVAMFEKNPPSQILFSQPLYIGCSSNGTPLGKTITCESSQDFPTKTQVECNL